MSESEMDGSSAGFSRRSLITTGAGVAVGGALLPTRLTPQAPAAAVAGTAFAPGSDSAADAVSSATATAAARGVPTGPGGLLDFVNGSAALMPDAVVHGACQFCNADCRLVIGRVDGRQVFYSLAQPELVDLLSSAEVLLEATGEAVALCPRYGDQL